MQSGCAERRKELGHKVGHLPLSESMELFNFLYIY
jgi:hypothetical protein